MPSQLFAVCFGASQPLGLAQFWSRVLGWELADDPRDGVALLPSDDTGFRIRVIPSQEHKTGQNRMHFDLTSASLEDQQQTVARALALGGQHIDVGQRPEDGHVVLADPEGNEFCVIEPGNNFLADCGFIGALACDGSQEVGYFWSEALGWPLVWDQDQETAIRSPHGGPKFTWGGPPVAPKTGAGTGCILTSLHLPTVTCRRRSSACSRSGRLESTPARARPAGWRWPIPTATSFAC
jgi:predicted enzyme related to lactoylglutathione lyase